MDQASPVTEAAAAPIADLGDQIVTTTTISLNTWRGYITTTQIMNRRKDAVITNSMRTARESMTRK